MDSDLWIILILLFFSAFFSGMEIAFLSSNKLKVEIDRQQGRFYASIAHIFVNNPGQFITTMLVGNNIVMVWYSALMTRMLTDHLTQYLTPTLQLLVNTLLSTLVILLMAEFLPKAIFRLRPNSFLSLLSVPALLFYIILYPLSNQLTRVSVFILRHIFRMNIREQIDQHFGKVDLMNLTHDAEVESSEDDYEHDITIFRNALDFSGVKLRDCIVPRTEIQAVELDDPVEEVRRAFIESGFSRLLVYKDTIDNIVGYIKFSDLFRSHHSIREMLMEVNYYPETMLAQKVMTQFIQDKQYLAVVVDEYGGTAGMVTLEDIMEEIFGEIHDEHDVDELIEREIEPGVYLLSGRLDVEDLNKRYQFNIPESEEYDTLAGYVLFQMEDIPRAGDVFHFEQMYVKIIKMSGARIDLMQLSKEDRFS